MVQEEKSARPTRKRATSSWALCGREADALQRSFHERGQSFHAERQCEPRRLPTTAWISSTLACARWTERAVRTRSEQQIKRLGRRHENVRGFLVMARRLAAKCRPCELQRALRYRARWQFAARREFRSGSSRSCEYRCSTP